MRQLKTILDPTAKSKVFLEDTAKTNKQTNKQKNTHILWRPHSATEILASVRIRKKKLQ